MSWLRKMFCGHNTREKWTAEDGTVIRHWCTRCEKDLLGRWAAPWRWGRAADRWLDRQSMDTIALLSVSPLVLVATVLTVVAVTASDAR